MEKNACKAGYLIDFQTNRFHKETRQVGKLVKHCENISNPSPELFKGVVIKHTLSHLYQINPSSDSSVLVLLKSALSHTQNWE